MSLAKRVRDRRYAKGWGPDELAQRAEISRTALYQIECGRTESPRAATLQKIAHALEIPVDDLLGIERAAVATNVLLRSPPPMSASIQVDLQAKFREILASPLGEGVARIVEESHRLLPSLGFA